MKTHSLILASSSPRRMELLNQFFIKHRAVPSLEHEPTPSENSNPSEFCILSARIKAESLVDIYPEELILGADTVVVHGNKILGKPKSFQESEKMIRQLSGTTHQVITGLCMIVPGENPLVHAETTEVVFRSLSESEINWYLASGDGMDKAGAYGIQSLAGCLISSINGDWFNVVGLPIKQVISWLRTVSPTLWPPSCETN